MIELNKKLAYIQSELKAPKNQFNKFANFYYRSCEDILEGIKPLLGGLTLTMHDEVVMIGDRYYVKATSTISDGEAAISASAYARESETKTGMDVAQVTGASSSYARKYSLNGLFAIDDADPKEQVSKEPDTQNNKVLSKAMTVGQEVKNPTVLTDEDKQNEKIRFAIQTLYATWRNAGFDVEIEKKALMEREHLFNLASYPLEKIEAEIKTVKGRDDDKPLFHKEHVECEFCKKPISSKIAEYSMKRYKKALCMVCQRKMSTNEQ